MTTTKSDFVETADDGPWDTIPEWCRKKGISKTAYYKIRPLGQGPKELRIPGTTIVRITAKADREWEERMMDLAQQESAQLEQQRRVEQARAAGRAAARSPLHISRRGKPDRAFRKQ